MTLEELKKIRTILSAATGLEDEDQEIIGAALKAIDALIKPRTTKPAAPVQELQRYSPNGEGGMKVDSLGAYVKHQDVSNPPEAPVQERELAGFAMKDGIPVSAVFSDGSRAVSVDGFTWTAQPPAAPVQKRPQNCGTGYCSCIECVMEPAPVQVDAWPCVIAEADFEQDTITLKMQCSDYKVGAGQHWLHTTKPAAQPAVPEGWKLVPAVPTNEWVNNLAKMQTGNLEEVPFVEIHQCIAELLAAAPKKGQL
jgi:hypothetical protein